MERSNSQSIPLHQTGPSKLRRLFNEVDTNNDGKVSYCELWALLRRDEHDLPKHIIRTIHERADRNDDGHLDYKEFVEMVHDPQNRPFFGRYMNRYIHALLPPQKRVVVAARGVSAVMRDEIDGLYEQEYSCWPPAVGMITVSVVIVALFFVDAVVDKETDARGTIATALLYNPHRRKEAWRYVTYMFVHVGYFHLFVNLVVQIMLGIPLEMVHHWWRVLVIYTAGVLAGSLGTSVTDPSVRLAGASGGVYSLILAHIATIIMNWKEMLFPAVQLLIFLVIMVTDVGTAIYNRVVLNKEEHIGYAAHFYGAVAGLLVGITLLRNLEVNRTEQIVQRVALVLYILLMATAIVWNMAGNGYFPEQFV